MPTNTLGRFNRMEARHIEYERFMRLGTLDSVHSEITPEFGRIGELPSDPLCAPQAANILLCLSLKHYRNQWNVA